MPQKFITAQSKTVQVRTPAPPMGGCESSSDFLPLGFPVCETDALTVLHPEQSFEEGIRRIHTKG